MKTIKIFLSAFALLATMLFWGFAFSAAGGSAEYGLGFGAGLFILGNMASHFGFMPHGIAMAGVYAEVWTGELIKQFGHADTATFLDGITDYSRYADKNVIHLVDVGADPDVLINNTTYPIDIQNLPDGDKAISLDKFQTKATRITDDELYGISYDKIGLKKEQHGKSIVEKKFDKAIHAMAPASNTTATPVIVTTGADDGTGRKKMLKKDILVLKKAWDKAKIPTKGRRLVLCPDHVNDLLEDDQKFADQYYNYITGKISNLYGFEVYEYVNNPYYVIAAKTKLGFGGVPVDGTHAQASVAFHPVRMFKASGETKMYFSEAKTDPTTQENLINFRHYYICLPKKNEAMGAIVSALVA